MNRIYCLKKINNVKFGHVSIREVFIGSIFSINLVVQKCDCLSLLDSLNNIVIQLVLTCI